LWHFQPKFTANSLLSLLVKEFKTQSTLGKVTGKKADCLTRSVCLGTVLLKDELASYLEYGKKRLLLTVVTLILTWLR